MMQKLANYLPEMANKSDKLNEDKMCRDNIYTYFFYYIVLRRNLH